VARMGLGLKYGRNREGVGTLVVDTYE